LILIPLQDKGFLHDFRALFKCPVKSCGVSLEVLEALARWLVHVVRHHPMMLRVSPDISRAREMSSVHQLMGRFVQHWKQN